MADGEWRLEPCGYYRAIRTPTGRTVAVVYGESPADARQHAYNFMAAEKMKELLEEIQCNLDESVWGKCIEVRIAQVLAQAQPPSSSPANTGSVESTANKT